MEFVDLDLYDIDMLPDTDVIDAHKTFCPPEWYWQNAGTKTFEYCVWLVLDGRGHLHDADGETELRHGDCFLFRHARPHLATHDPKHPLVVQWSTFHFLDQRGKPCRPPESDLPRRHRRPRDMPFLLGLLERGEAAYWSDRPQDSCLWLRPALLELLRQDALSALPAEQQALIEEIDAMCLQIEQDIARPPSVRQMAERLGYSQDHFIRLFRRQRGVTPGEYVIRRRVAAAEELLRSTNHSVTQISQMLGYSDVYAFSKQFRQRTGKAPTAARAEQRG